MVVEPMRRIHLDEVTRLHHENLTGLLRRLGARAIRGYYRAALARKESLGFVALSHDRVTGFVFGSTEPGTLTRSTFLSRWYDTVPPLLWKVLTRPGLAVDLLRTLRGARGDIQTAELIYLAVDRSARRDGIAKNLVATFSQDISTRGAESYELSVDDDNQAAIPFYENLGFRLTGTFEEFGVLRRRYRFVLSPDSIHKLLGPST